METETKLTRQDYVQGLMWNGEYNQFWYQYQKSNDDKNKVLNPNNYRHRLGKYDIKSVVVINGTPEEFTDEELEKLYIFSVLKTNENDDRYNDRIGTRRKIITKTISTDLWLMKPWLAKFEGSEYIKTMDTLDEVLEYFKNH